MDFEARLISRFNKEIRKRREDKTVDIANRIGVITPDRIHLRNYPISRPVTAFNPSIVLNDENLVIYARIILGYFTYASAVAEIKIPIEDLSEISKGIHNADIVVYPDNKYDIWGVEDPRVYRLGGRLFMTYCGRTVNYFNPAIRVERTLPVTAVCEEGVWKKVFVFRACEDLRPHVISNKDAFLARFKELLLFHRPHMDNGKFYIAISKISPEILESMKFREVIFTDLTFLFEEAKFEKKIGWGTPPIKIGREYLLFLHGVGVEYECYRVFAILMDQDAEVTAITPYYIMAPKESYEKYGDRPCTIFPCGAALYDGKILISYGAADSAIGLAEINLDELMSILDSNRLY